MEELKPCSFCGGEGYIEIKDRADWREYYQTGYIVCKRCGCRTMSIDTSPGWKKIAIEAWNRRVNNG